MSFRKCCVPGCSVKAGDDSGLPLHTFPNPTNEHQRFQMWTQNIGGEVTELDDMYIFKNRRVCHKHFEPVYYYPKNRLSGLAVPTLNTAVQHVALDPEPSTSFGEIERNLTTTICPVSHSSREHLIPMAVDETIVGHQYIKKQRRKTRRLSKPLLRLELQLSKLKAKLRRSEHQKKLYKFRLTQAKQFIKSDAFEFLSQNMSNEAKNLFKIQISQGKKQPKGRRFTLDQKILALSLYKPSPKAYRMLSQVCILPKRKTLQKLLQKIDLKPGINKTLIKNLKRKVAALKKHQRYCIILFDEMMITPGLTYSRGKNIITGFCDNGDHRKKDFADHVLVFMIRGVIKKFKQPVCFSYCQGTTEKYDLINQIKNVIKNVKSTGLNVIATVCDQGTTNVAAMNALENETKAHYLRANKEYRGGFFKLDDDIIYPLYDPPHLMKGIRNNLLTKNLIYSLKGKKCIAKWEHIEAIHHKGPEYKGIRILSKLTARHVVPKLIPKMRVKYCTQVFSKSVGAGIGFMADGGFLPMESKQTADLLIFFDDLFDSVNGSYSEVRGAKFLRGAVTPKSMHKKFWSECLPVLKSMYFIDSDGKNKSVPSVRNWIKTIERFQTIVRFLHNLGHTSLLLRHFNQDPLENFFGAIRSHGQGNTKPNVSAFESAYKTLLINNMTSHHSVGSNCEKDKTPCFQTIKYLLTEDIVPETTNIVSVYEEDIYFNFTIDVDSMLQSKLKNDLEKCAAAGYCSGWILKLLKKKICKSCTLCKENFESQNEIFHSFIKLKEYCDGKTWLLYPSKEFFVRFLQIEHIVYETLNRRCAEKDIGEYCKLLILLNIDFNYIRCITHKQGVIDFLVQKSIVFFINNWCKEINNIICGKTLIATEEVNKLDEIRRKAYTCFLKRKKK